MADEEYMTVSERRKARNEQKRNIKKETSEEIATLIKEYDEIVAATNRLVPPKITKPEVLSDGTTFDKKYVQELQHLFKATLEGRIRGLINKHVTPQVREQSRNNNYSRACYVNQKVVDWLLDERVNFKSNKVTAFINNDDCTDTVPYEGQSLADVLMMTRKGEIDITDSTQDGSYQDENQISIPILGIANRAIFCDLINCYMVQNKLKGVEVTTKKKTKDGEIEVKKINNSYWRIDDVLLTYFGDAIDDIVEKERKKAHGKTPITSDGIEITRHCIKNGAMAIMSAMIDTERTSKYKEYLHTLQDAINNDAAVTRAVYERIKGDVEK